MCQKSESALFSRSALESSRYKAQAVTRILATSTKMPTTEKERPAAAAMKSTARDHPHTINVPVAIDLRGVKGPNAVTISGVYEPAEEYCNGWPV
jgi:hypothetical protein